jgi:hypothetical protein
MQKNVYMTPDERELLNKVSAALNLNDSRTIATAILALAIDLGLVSPVTGEAIPAPAEEVL